MSTSLLCFSLLVLTNGAFRRDLAKEKVKNTTDGSDFLTNKNLVRFFFKKPKFTYWKILVCQVKYNLIRLFSESFQVLEACSFLRCFVLNRALNGIVSHIPANPRLLPGGTELVDVQHRWCCPEQLSWCPVRVGHPGAAHRTQGPQDGHIDLICPLSFVSTCSTTSLLMAGPLSYLHPSLWRLCQYSEIL